MKFLNKALALIGISLLLFAFSTTTAVAGTATDQIRKGVDTAAGEDKTTAKPGDLTSFIARIINIISVVVGVIAVLMLIFGGFRYVASGGNDSSVAAAKNTIVYAIIGLVIVAMAQVIVKFVLTTATQTQETTSTTTSGPGSSNDRLPSQRGKSILD